MDTRKKRLTLDLDAALQRRLKAVAALKGVSKRHYCQVAIEKELAADEAEGGMDLPSGHEALDGFEALRAAIFGGRPPGGDSTDLIREARRSRDAP